MKDKTYRLISRILTGKGPIFIEALWLVIGAALSGIGLGIIGILIGWAIMIGP